MPGFGSWYAVLGHHVEPTPNDPEYVARWGDWEECDVEVKPLRAGVPPGEIVPVIESLGNMDVDWINISGYATGENDVGLKGVDSPFDGKIRIDGFIAYAPNSSEPGIARLRYRIMVKRPSYSEFQASLREFPIDITYIPSPVIPPPPVTQTPDPDGWMDYYPDFLPPGIVSVDQNLLGVFVPEEEGLHSLYVEMFDPNTGHTAQSNTVNFMVDKTAPDVDIEITSGTGNCGVFTQGDVLRGTFSIADAHCKKVKLSVTPAAEAHGAKPTIDGSGGLSALEYGSGLPGTGISGNWTLNTDPMDPCGYNVRVLGVERTIINSRWVGRHTWDIEGFCLEIPDKG